MVAVGAPNIWERSETGERGVELWVNATARSFGCSLVSRIFKMNCSCSLANCSCRKLCAALGLFASRTAIARCVDPFVAAVAGKRPTICQTGEDRVSNVAHRLFWDKMRRTANWEKGERKAFCVYLASSGRASVWFGVWFTSLSGKPLGAGTLSKCQSRG